MKQRQLKRLLSYLETGLVCRENISIIAMMPGMKRCVQQFDGLLLDVLENMYKQAEPITHHAKEKLKARVRLVTHVARLCNMACGYGAEINSNQVLCFFNHSYSSIFRKYDNHVVALCKVISEELIKYQDKLKDFGIRKKEMDELNDLIKLFDKHILIPGNQIRVRKLRTQDLTNGINLTGKLLNERMDKLLSFFEQFPEFTAAYKASRKQVKHDVTKPELEKKIEEFYMAPKMKKLRKKKEASANPDKYGTGPNQYEFTNEIENVE